MQPSDLFGWQRDISVPEATVTTPVAALVGWFNVSFCPAADRADGLVSCVELTTSPLAPLTHWAHTTLPLQTPLTAPELSLQLTQSARSHHDLNVTLTYGETAALVVDSFEVGADFRGDSKRVQDYVGDEDNHLKEDL